MKLFNKLLSIFLPVSLFYLFAFWLVLYLLTSNYVEQKLRKDFSAISALHIKTINLWVVNVEEQLQAFKSRLLVRSILANYPDTQLPREEQLKLQSILVSTRDRVSSFDQLYLINVAGDIVASTAESDLASSNTLKEQVQNEAATEYLARPVTTPTGDRYLQHLISLELSGHIVGYLVAQGQTKSLQDLMQSNTGLGNDGKLTIYRNHLEQGLQPLFSAASPDIDIDSIVDTLDQQLQWFMTETTGGEILLAHLEKVDSLDWHLLITTPKSQAFDVILEIRWFGIFSVLLAGVLLIFNIIYVARLLSSPIERLAHHASHLNDAREPELFQKSGIAEYDKLASRLNRLMQDVQMEKNNLESNVYNRTKDLASKNLELKRTMTELRNTQQLLVETEKMAVLGEMVAGVAHEVNTPIGSALGAATHLSETSDAVKFSWEKGELTEQEFETLLIANQHASDIIVSNLNRANELIRSFKRVAVDQSNEKLQEFDLVEYIKDVVLSLGPRYKHMKLEFVYSGVKGIRVRQIPGIIAQITTNLVVNAIVHAFENKPRGRLEINIEAQNENNLELRISDDGKGMTREISSKLFDPFFTTKRGMGGTGLGLNIVYNLVVKNLSGHISVRSEPEKGSAFTLRFPIIQKGVQM